MKEPVRVIRLIVGLTYVDSYMSINKAYRTSFFNDQSFREIGFTLVKLQKK